LRYKKISPEILRPAYRLYRLAWGGLDWLYPPQCGGCGKAFTHWCKRCQSQVQRINENVCDSCGRVVNTPGKCPECLLSPPAYTALRSWAVYAGPVREAIHSLKYKGDISLGEVLSRNLLELVEHLNWRVDLLTPVPISLARRKARGYNQASMLALPLALGCSVTYQPQSLVKMREVPTQVGLTAEQRRVNVRQAFQARSELVLGKSVLVVDDITTSGATMQSCAEALINAGAQQVYGLTLARAVLEEAI
jgi:competence protein ComFC